MEKIVRNYNIIGFDDKVTIGALVRWSKKQNASQAFCDLATNYYRLAKLNNVNLAFAFSQFATETGFLYKNGSAAGLDASYCNPCGLKITGGGGNYDKNAHMRFPNWDTGIQAQLDHALLYAGAPGYPKAQTPDPRHFASIKGTAPKVVDLGGKWASGKEYGNSLVKRMDTIYDVVDELIDIQNSKPKQNLFIYYNTEQRELATMLATAYKGEVASASLLAHIDIETFRVIKVDDKLF